MPSVHVAHDCAVQHLQCLRCQPSTLRYVALLQAQARLRLLLEPSYGVLEYELASALHCIIYAHWQRLLHNTAFRPTVQVCHSPTAPVY